MQDGRGKAGWRPPWGFLGMLGLVMAIEWTLAGHDLDFTAPWHWDWRVIGKAATRPDRVKDKELLFFGDSLVKFGLMPKVIQQGTGKTAYNFALHTGQTSSSYFMLRRTLRAGARPSASRARPDAAHVHAPSRRQQEPLGRTALARGMPRLRLGDA